MEFRGIPWCEKLGFWHNQPGGNSSLYNINEATLQNGAGDFLLPERWKGGAEGVLKFYHSAPHGARKGF